MNFKDWKEGMEALGSKVKRGTLYDISETIGVGGTTVAITIGKGGLHVEQGDYRSDLKQLRPLFTPNKEEFENLLEALTDRIDKAIESTEDLLTQVVAPIIPEAVIGRLKGSVEGDADNKDLLQLMVQKGLAEIAQKFFKYPNHPFDSFDINFEPIKERPFILAYAVYQSGRNRFTLEVCGSHLDAAYPEDANICDDMETCLYFLANFETIKAKLKEFFNTLATIKK